MPKMLNLGFRGKVQTWWDLWGTWATGAFYGQRVYDIYTRMVEFAATDPRTTGTPVPEPTPARRIRRADASVSRTGRRRMPVCLLLRVHSTGPVELDRADAREQLGHARRGSRGGPGSRRGSGARRARSRDAGSAARRTSKRNGSANTSSSRFADASQNTTLSPARDLVAAELDARGSRCGGCTRRDASSARSPRSPVGIASGSSRSAASWSGNSRERDDRARDRVAGRVGARGPQQAEEELQLLVGELRRVLARQRRVAHDREHVVGRMRALLGDEPGAVLEHRGRGVRDVVGGLERLAVVLEVEAVLDPFEELVAIRLGDAHQDADRLHRQLARDRRREVARARARARRRRAARCGAGARLRAARSCAASAPCSRAGGPADGAGRPSC